MKINQIEFLLKIKFIKSTYFYDSTKNNIYINFIFIDYIQK